MRQPKISDKTSGLSMDGGVLDTETNLAFKIVAPRSENNDTTFSN